MIKLKNYTFSIWQHLFLATFLFIASCSKQTYEVSKIEGKKIGITQNINKNEVIDNFIKPYRDKIDSDMSQILAYCPETLDKSKGQWQTNIGNFIADITLAKSQPIFERRTGHKIDACLLNHGGIRAIIAKGNVTMRNAFEVMPFENSAIVVGLKAPQIIALCQYICNEKKSHPLAGITFTISKDGIAKNININGKPLNQNEIYYIVTSDYLSNGGDNMIFFKTNVSLTDIDYKLRNIIIDTFKETDTLVLKNDIRISQE